MCPFMIATMNNDITSNRSKHHGKTCRGYPSIFNRIVFRGDEVRICSRLLLYIKRYIYRYIKRFNHLSNSLNVKSRGEYTLLAVSNAMGVCQQKSRGIKKKKAGVSSCTAITMTNQ